MVGSTGVRRDDGTTGSTGREMRARRTGKAPETTDTGQNNGCWSKTTGMLVKNNGMPVKNNGCWSKTMNAGQKQRMLVEKNGCWSKALDCVQRSGGQNWGGPNEETVNRQKYHKDMSTGQRDKYWSKG